MASGRHRRSRALALVAALVALLPAAPAPVSASTPVDGLVAPVLVSPAPYAPSGAPILEWRAVPGAIRYVVDLQPVPATNFGVCGGETESLRMTCDWIPPGPYTWSVRAIGVENRPGPASIVRSLTKVPRPLGTPAILAPANGTTFDVASGVGMLRWSPVPDAAYYQVQISDVSTFPGPAPDATYASLPMEGMVAPVDVIGRVRYWRVRAVTHSKAEVGPWSAARSFTVRWSAPVPSAPADGATVGNAVLDWGDVAGAVRYDLEVTLSSDTGFADPILVSDPRASHFDLGSTPQSVRWRVRAVDWAGGKTAWSTPRTVVIDPAGEAMAVPDPIALATPTLLAPADGANAVDPVATPLRWAPVLGTIGYDLQVVPVDQDWHVIDGSAPNVPSSPAVPNLDFGVTYKWRVRANATAGLYRAGEWSEERTFTTKPRGTVALAGPADGGSVSYEDVLFTWTALPSAPIYAVELSRTPGFEEPVWIPAYRDGRVESRNALDPGTWYWRVRAGHDNVKAMSPVRTVTIVDDVGPAGVVGPHHAYSLADTITVGGPAEDTVSEIDRYAVSANGTDWEEWDYRDEQPWSLVTPEHGGPDQGLRTLWFKWRDTAGNWSAPRTQRLWYGLPPDDVTPPVVSAPRVTGVVPASSIPASGSVPIRIVWSGTDDLGSVRYELTRRTDSAGGAALVLSSYVGLTHDQLVPPQHSYRYTLRGEDAQHNVSDYAIGPTYAVSRFGDTSKSIVYKGSWASSSSSSFWGGTARRSMTAGSTATFTFTGRSVGLVALRASNRGAATIYVNGTKVATIDLYSRTYLGRQIVWSMDWSTSARRTVTVRVAGTSGRPRVDIDGFVVVR